MKILALSDWRKPIETIENIVITHEPDVILYAGDNLDRFFKPDGALLLKLGVPFYFVNGNHDRMLYANNKYYNKIYPLNEKEYILTETSEGKIKIEKNINISQTRAIAFSDSKSIDKKLNPSNFLSGIYQPINPNFGNFSIQNKNEEVTVFGSECSFGIESDILNIPNNHANIFLSHIPPLGTLDLSSLGLRHIGSKKLLDSIKKYHPRYVICGHTHIWGGQYAKIGRTTIINVSSNAKNENYVIINTDDWSAKLESVKDEKMSFIGLGTIRHQIIRKCADFYDTKKEIEIMRLYDDVCEWRSLSPKKRSAVLERVEKLGINTKRFEERNESFKWKKPKILRKLTIDTAKSAFVDVETGQITSDKEPGKLWLIGVLYNDDFKQFIYPQEKNQFLSFLKQYNIKSLVSWGIYDHKLLRPILEKANVAIKFIDASRRTSKCVIWHTYHLDEFYQALFPDENNRDNIIHGNIAGLYADHLIISNKSCQYCPPKDKIINQIKKRNMVDILQMIEICIKLSND